MDAMPVCRPADLPCRLMGGIGKALLSRSITSHTDSGKGTSVMPSRGRPGTWRAKKEAKNSMGLSPFLFRASSAPLRLKASIGAETSSDRISPVSPLQALGMRQIPLPTQLVHTRALCRALLADVYEGLPVATCALHKRTRSLSAAILLSQTRLVTSSLECPVSSRVDMRWCNPGRPWQGWPACMRLHGSAWLLQPLSHQPLETGWRLPSSASPHAQSACPWATTRVNAPSCSSLASSTLH